LADPNPVTDRFIALLRSRIEPLEL